MNTSAQRISLLISLLRNSNHCSVYPMSLSPVSRTPHTQSHCNAVCRADGLCYHYSHSNRSAAVLAVVLMLLIAG